MVEPSCLKGDVNGDGPVDIQDIVIIVETFGSLGEDLPTDLNDDGVVDITDIVIAATHLGERI